MEMTRELTINASADKVWDIVGFHFNDVADWASFVYESHGNPDLPDDRGRVCQTQFGPVKETMLNFDPSQRTLAHSVEGKSTPPFMKDIENIWHIESRADGRADVRFTMKARVLPPFKQFLGRRLTNQFTKQADGFLRQLQHFAETDRVHPKKEAALVAA